MNLISYAFIYLNSPATEYRTICTVKKKNSNIFVCLVGAGAAAAIIIISIITTVIDVAVVIVGSQLSLHFEQINVYYISIR